MSKYVTIKDGGIGRKFKASMLETLLQTNGSCKWVPKDEVQLEELYVTENGHYEPNKFAFSKVTVNIYDYSLGYIQGYDPVSFEFKVISVEPLSQYLVEQVVPGDFPELNVTPFVADGLQIATVNVETGEIYVQDFGEGFEHTIDQISANNADWVAGYNPTNEDWEIASVTPNGLEIEDFGFNPVTPDGTKITPPNVADIDLGSGVIVGMDDLGNVGVASIDGLGNVQITNLSFTPNTFAFDASGMMTGVDINGNEFVATLSNGAVTEHPLPSSIEIIVQPTKTEYEDGEEIDITGMVVKACLADGSTWTSAQYPNGHIPLQEIDVSVKSVSSNKKTYYGDLEVPFTTEPIGTLWIFRKGTSLFHNYINGFFPLSGGVKIAAMTHASGGAMVPYSVYESNLTLKGKTPEPNNEAGVTVVASNSNMFCKKEWYIESNQIEEPTYRSDIDPHSEYSYINTKNFYTQNGKTVYYSWASGDLYVGTLDATALNEHPTSSYTPSCYKEIAWEMIYGESTSVMTVEISWKRPIDELPLTAELEFTLTTGG